MAEGLGFKTFITGEVLTAADVNGYLMQGVLVFASEAARDAAITSPEEGQFAYTKDNNSLWYYTGSVWAASGATGDIEGVTAGTGISGGGTSGTVTITNSMATEIDAKGDLVVGTAADTFARLAVGTDGHTLVADSGAATGLAYSAGIPVVLNAQTATYIVVLGDAYKLVTMSNAAANDFQIPTNANVAFPVGTVINVIQIGAGKTTIEAVTPGTTTISSTGATATAPELRAQFSAASCIKVATDTWYVVGDIA
jgi:hypothetical protein